MSTTTAIDIPFAASDALHLHLAVGACRSFWSELTLLMR